MHNRTLLFGSTLLMNDRHFDYWNQPLNMRMRFCYLDCHEGGLSRYLMVHIGNLLRPLQLFYFHLWLIYWLSFVHTKFRKDLFRRSNLFGEDAYTCTEPSDLGSPFFFLQNKKSRLKTICMFSSDIWVLVPSADHEHRHILKDIQWLRDLQVCAGWRRYTAVVSAHALQHGQVPDSNLFPLIG
jgi:hypothetical protein